jgi:RNA polymerase sigma-B factor
VGTARGRQLALGGAAACLIDDRTGDEWVALIALSPPSHAREAAASKPPRSVAMAEADATLFDRRRNGDPRAREQLVARFLPLARHLARRYRGQADQQDLEQVASLALLKAIDRFDPDRGLAFSTFAVPTILGELKRYFRDLSWSVHVPRSVKDLTGRLDADTRALSAELGRSPTPAELAERAGTKVECIVEAMAANTAHYADSLDRPVSEDGGTVVDLLGGELDPGYEHAEDATLVASLLATLPEREQIILRLRFEQELTQAEIGERIGISQMHVSRLIRRSIARLQATAARAASPAVSVAA